MNKIGGKAGPTGPSPGSPTKSVNKKVVTLYSFIYKLFCYQFGEIPKVSFYTEKRVSLHLRGTKFSCPWTSKI